MAILILDQRRILSSIRAVAASVASFQSPTSAYVIRPSGRTAVASMVSKAAPESTRWPRWIRCQSVMQPSTAEYWHMGAMTMRFASARSPTRKGVNNTLMPSSSRAPRRVLATDGHRNSNSDEPRQSKLMPGQRQEALARLAADETRADIASTVDATTIGRLQ